MNVAAGLRGSCAALAPSPLCPLGALVLPPTIALMVSRCHRNARAMAGVGACGAAVRAPGVAVRAPCGGGGSVQHPSPHSGCAQPQLLKPTGHPMGGTKHRIYVEQPLCIPLLFHAVRPEEREARLEAGSSGPLLACTPNTPHFGQVTSAPCPHPTM